MSHQRESVSFHFRSVSATLRISLPPGDETLAKSIFRCLSSLICRLEQGLWARFDNTSRPNAEIPRDFEEGNLRLDTEYVAQLDSTYLI